MFFTDALIQDKLLECPLPLQFCTSNEQTAIEHYGSSIKALEESSLFFTIGTLAGVTDAEIPRNYFCRWQVDLDPRRTYQWKLERSRLYEDIEIQIVNGGKVTLVSK